MIQGIRAILAALAIGLSPMALASALSAPALPMPTDPVQAAAQTGEYVGEHGGWAVAGVLALVIGWLGRQYILEMKGRREDQKTMGEIITAATVSNNASITAQEERNKAFAASIQSQALTVAQVTSNGLGISAIAQKLDEVKAELSRTREALIGRGHISP